MPIFNSIKTFYWKFNC